MSEFNPSEPPSEGADTTDSPSAARRDEPKKKRKPIVIAGIAVGALVVVAAGTLVAMTAFQPSPIERAGEACAGSKPLQALFDSVEATASPEAEDGDIDDGEFADLFDGVVSVEDGGKSLIVNTKPQDEDALGVTSLSLDCVYEQLDVPTHISERISQTRALDGRQEGDWDSYTASWSYHPDDGANVIIVQD